MLEWFQWMPGMVMQMRGGESMTTHEEILPWLLPNVWLGVSVENQQTADERIPLLLQVPAAVRWLSMEPLLGPMNIQQYLYNTITSFTPTSVSLLTDGTVGLNGNVNDMTPRLNWVVVGGESGPKARPMHPDWARSLRDQCTAAGVPFFKQWGEGNRFITSTIRTGVPISKGRFAIMDAKGFRWEDEDFQPTTDAMPTCWEFQRIRKKASGRLRWPHVGRDAEGELMLIIAPMLAAFWSVTPSAGRKDSRRRCVCCTMTVRYHTTDKKSAVIKLESDRGEMNAA